MKRFVTLVLVLLGGLAALAAPAVAQDNDAEATIAALETRVAELEAQLTPTAPAASAATLSLDDAPVPLNDAFVLLYYIGEVDDDVRAYGEIRNVSDQGAVAPEVVFSFLDEDGTEIGEESVAPVWG